MIDPEMVSTPLDKRGTGDKARGGIPRHERGRRTGKPPGPPVVWAVREAIQIDVWGQLPLGFVQWVAPLLGAAQSDILHLCSGALRPEHGGIRVDIRSEVLPDIVADVRALPIKSSSVAAALIDPPYSVEYAEGLYGVEYPRPSHLLSEAARVVRPCGRIGFVHYLVPYPPNGCRVVDVLGVSTGCGYRIRALTIFEKEQDRLF